MPVMFMRELSRRMFLKVRASWPPLKAGIQALFIMDCNMDMGNFIGKMAAFIEDTTREEFVRVMVNFSMERARVSAGVSGDEACLKGKGFTRSQEAQVTV